jgi:hypothetical protein
MAERPKGKVGKPGSLLGGRLRQRDPAVADLHDEQSRQAVEKSPSVRVVDVAALASLDNGNLAVGKCAQTSEVHPQMAMRLVLQ